MSAENDTYGLAPEPESPGPARAATPRQLATAGYIPLGAGPASAARSPGNSRRANLLLLALLLAAIPALPILAGPKSDTPKWVSFTMQSEWDVPMGTRLTAIWPLAAAVAVGLVALKSRGRGGSAVLLLAGAGYFVALALDSSGSGRTRLRLPVLGDSEAWRSWGGWLVFGLIGGWMASWAGCKALSRGSSGRAARAAVLAGGIALLVILLLPVWPPGARWMPRTIIDSAGEQVAELARRSPSGSAGLGGIWPWVVGAGFYTVTTIGALLGVIATALRGRWAARTAWLLLVAAVVLLAGGWVGASVDGLGRVVRLSGHALTAGQSCNAVVNTLKMQVAPLLLLLLIPIGLADLMSLTGEWAGKQELNLSGRS